MLHTPTPWIIRNMSDTTTSKEAFCERYTIEVCSDGLRSVLADIREVNMCPEHGGTAEANAEFIVRACNTHADLLAALERLAEKVRIANVIQHGVGPLSEEDWSELYQLQNESFGLIAKVKGAI